MSNSQVLQDYLVKLGYTVDQISLGRFNASMSSTSKSILRVGGAVAGVVAGIEASTAAFAYSMRQMYFQSQLANSSIQNLNAYSFANKQIGVDAESTTNALKTLQRNMRLNPGMTQFIESLTGKRQQGRPADKIMEDVIGKLRQWPEWLGANYAQQIFGMDADTYHLTLTQWDTLQRKKDEALQIYKNMGLDPDKGAKALLDYATTMDTLSEKFKSLGQVMLISFAPEFTAINQMVSDAIDWWADWARGINHVSDLFRNLDIKSIGKLLKEAYGQSEADAAAGKKKGPLEWLLSSPFDPKVKPAPQAPIAPTPPTPIGAGPAQPVAPKAPAPGVQAAPTPNTDKLFGGLERRYQLPQGLMDSLYVQESARGKNTYNQKSGAEGPFQFMPKTSKEYGLDNPYDLESSAGAAARKMANLLRYYKNDKEKAVAAYNFGEGNLDKHIAKQTAAGKDWKNGLNKETSAYIGDVLGRVDSAKLGDDVQAGTTTVTMNTNISVTGDNARDIGNEVAARQQGVLTGAVRNLRGLQ